MKESNRINYDQVSLQEDVSALPKEHTSLLHARNICVQESVDGRHTTKRKSIIREVCSFILITEFCERLAYYGLSGSLPIFFRRNLGMSSVLATEVNSLFSSVTYVTPLLGAYVADKHLGRFRTIMYFCAIYLVGLMLCAAASYPSHTSPGIFLFGLFIGVGFGAGGIKPNVVVLGADQFDVSDPIQQLEKESFFNWFYWSINIGATFSFGFLTNIAVSGLPPLIPVSYGFFASFSIPAIIFLLAFMVFFAGRSRYRRVPPQGSALISFVRIMYFSLGFSWRGKILAIGIISIPPAIIITAISYFINDPSTHFLFAVTGAILVLVGTICLIIGGYSTEWVLQAYHDSERKGVEDRSGILVYPLNQVKDATKVLRLTPYLSFLVMFWAVYGQQGSNFIIQGCQMDLRLNTSSSDADTKQISAAMLSILDSSIILIFIPIFDKFIYPSCDRCGFEPTILRKIGCGFIFCCFAMIAAAFVEIQRKSQPNIENIISNCARSNEILPMSSISVWWQTPQYMLIGIGEILTSISAYNLFYSEVPESMRSVCQALNLLTSTLGYIVAGAINSVMSSWITSDLNDGKLENVFFLVAFIMLLNFFGFVYVSHGFEYMSKKASSKNDGSTVSGYSPALPRAQRAARSLLGKLSRKNNS